MPRGGSATSRQFGIWPLTIGGNFRERAAQTQQGTQRDTPPPRRCPHLKRTPRQCPHLKRTQHLGTSRADLTNPESHHKCQKLQWPAIPTRLRPPQTMTKVRTIPEVQATDDGADVAADTHDYTGDKAHGEDRHVRENSRREDRGCVETVTGPIE